MLSRVAYYRVSTRDQSVEAQRNAIGGVIDREFVDHGVSGGTLAEDRKAFRELASYVREGDTVAVYAIDRLGRDAIDVQKTVRSFLDKGVSVEVLGLGVIARGVGELIVAVLAQIANLERDRISERCASGRAAARASLAATGLTHRGKASMGRPKIANAGDIIAYRATGASIRDAADTFGVSVATIKRYCASSS